MASMLSSFRNRPLAQNTAFIGECGLGGELRPVNHMTERLRECARMGFTHCIVPKSGKKADWTKCESEIKLVMCGKIGEIQNFIF